MPLRSCRLRVSKLLLAAVLAVFASVASGAEPDLGSVRGAVVLGLDGARVSDLGPVVVYLEPRGERAVAPSDPEPLVVHQKNARFAPPFGAVAAGGTVTLQNDDEIYHNVFSYSRDNEFDLGTYPAGDARSVKLKSPGAVRIYCSIHENMNGTIFVSPTRWFARASPNGAFEIENVPPGDYTLTVWCEKLPDVRRDIAVAGGEVTRIEVPLADVGVVAP